MNVDLWYEREVGRRTMWPRWVAEWWLCGAARSWYGMVCLNGTSGMKDDVFQELV